MDSLTGQQFGKYRLIRRLGEGGTAYVYLAEGSSELQIKQRAALKLLKPRFSSDPVARTAFLDEMRVVSQLHHPTVVQTLDMGSDADTLFLAMEFVDGLTLAEILDRAVEGRLPVGHACYIGAQVADALRYAHELDDADGQNLGIVHRDVTPENVLISRAGAVKLSDFGIALAASRSSKTEVGLVRGKPHYISPEQIAGDVVSVRTDLYSLGVVLYEAISGVLPFTGDNPLAILTRVRDGGARPIAQLAPHIPEGLGRLIDSMLQQDPQVRPASAAEVHQRLMPFAVEYSRPISSADLRSLVERALAPTPWNGPLDSTGDTQEPLAEESSGLWQVPTVRRVLPTVARRARRSRLPLLLAPILAMSLVVVIAVLWRVSTAEVSQPPAARSLVTTVAPADAAPRIEHLPVREPEAKVRTAKESKPERAVPGELELEASAPSESGQRDEPAASDEPVEDLPSQKVVPRRSPASSGQGSPTKQKRKPRAASSGRRGSKLSTFERDVLRVLDERNLELQDFPQLAERVRAFTSTSTEGENAEELESILQVARTLEATSTSVSRRIERCSGRIEDGDDRALYNQAKAEYAFGRISVANSLLHAMCKRRSER